MAPKFTDGELAIIKQTVWETLEQWEKRAIPRHEDTCRHGQRLMKICYVVIGLGIGLGLSNAGLWVKVLGLLG